MRSRGPFGMQGAFCYRAQTTALSSDLTCVTESAPIQFMHIRAPFAAPAGVAQAILKIHSDGA